MNEQSHNPVDGVPGADLARSDAALFDLVCAGDPTADDLRKLEARLTQSPEARVHYLQYAGMHADLHGAERFRSTRSLVRKHVLNDPVLSAPPESSAVQNSAAQNSAAQTGSSSAGRWRAAVGLLSLAAGLLAMVVLSLRPGGGVDLAALPDNVYPRAVASIKRVSDVDWSPLQRRFVVNDLVVADDVLAIESGVVEVAFRQGAVAILEGPAELAIHNENHATLRRGNLAAVAPPWAVGFRIDTPKLHVIDYGTKFVVRVDDSQDDPEVQVVVSQGEVEVFQPDDRDNARRLLTGDGVRTQGQALEQQAQTDHDHKLTSQLPNLPGRDDVVVVGDRWNEWRPGTADQPRREGAWRHFTNVDGPFGDPSCYQELRWNENKHYGPEGNSPNRAPEPLRFVRVHRDGGHPGQSAQQSSDGLDHYCITGFVVPEDGCYHIEGGWLERPETKKWQELAMLDVAAHVNGGPILFQKFCDKNCFVAFSGALGQLKRGDVVYLGVGPGNENFNDRFRMGFYVVRELAPANKRAALRPALSSDSLP